MAPHDLACCTWLTMHVKLRLMTVGPAVFVWFRKKLSPKKFPRLRMMSTRIWMRLMSREISCKCMIVSEIMNTVFWLRTISTFDKGLLQRPIVCLSLL